MSVAKLTEEAKYWNAEFEKLFDFNPGIGWGSPMHEVHVVQSQIMRHYIDAMKKVIHEQNIQRT